MKLKGKKLLSIVLALVMVVTLLPATMFKGSTNAIYLKKGTWSNGDERFAAYFYNSLTEAHMWKNPEAEKTSEGYYKFAVPSGYDKVIFVRMNGSTTENKWENKWNQTENLTVPTDGNILYEITGWGINGGNSIGKWESYTPTDDDGGDSGNTGTDTPAEGTTRIYFDTSAYAGGGWARAYVHIWESGKETIDGQMTAVSGDEGVYYYDVPNGYTNIIFRPNDGDNWTGQTNGDTIPSDKNLFTATTFGDRTSGTWGTYTASGTGTGSGGTSSEPVIGSFNVNTMLVDYFNDNRVGNPSTTDFQGSSTGSGASPYSKFNAWISGLAGYAKATAASSGSGTTSDSTNQTIYWNNDGRIGDVWIYYWTSGGDGTFKQMTYKGLVDGMYLYEVDIPKTANMCIFTGSNGWDKKLTGDLTISGNLYNNGWSNYNNPGATTTDTAVRIPLYLGDLWNKNQLIGGNSVNSWYRGANVAFTETNAVAQGIVGKNLVGGKLVASHDDAVLVPYFEKTDAYANQDTYMQFYENLQMPFKSTTVNGVTTYSFNSKEQTVYYENGALYSSDTKIKDHDNGDVGFFPFNKTNPSDKSKLNYGFGAKFTIPFTITEDGKDINGEDIKFEFTGDDDVWVFIDGALVLDMGGAHALASGNINFATQTANVTTGTANAATGKDEYGGNQSYVSNGKATVSFSNITVKLADGTTTTLDKHIQKKDEVHTLTMFYMERGMWDSNMSISFSFSPIPSGLVVSKDYNVSDINDALEAVVEGVDKFNFTVGATNLLSNNAKVNFVQYTLTDHDSVSTSKTTTDNTIVGIRGDRYASNFLDAAGTDAFLAGTRFSITEVVDTENPNTVFSYNWDATEWKVFDADNGYALVTNGGGRTAGFDMGSSSSNTQTESYNYSLNFINKMNVGNLTLKKVYPGSASGATYEFTILLDLDGAGYTFAPTAYALNYTSSNGTQGTLTAEGKVNLKAGETITIAGIPAGATYEITETVPVDEDWRQNITLTSGTTGTITAGGTASAIVTNEAKGNIILNSDRIVMDFGKNILVDVLKNDGQAFVDAAYIATTAEYTKNANNSYKVGSAGSVELIGFEKSATATSSSGTTGSTGVVSYKLNNGQVEIELTGMLSKVEKVYCVAKVTLGSGTTKTLVSELQVIPANIMYYETDFADGVFATTGSWTTQSVRTEEDLLNNYQDDGTVGIGNVYGQDSSYADDTIYSDGASSYVEGQGRKKTYVNFSFTGTGFDLISRTGEQQGTIRVEIYSDAAMKNRVKTISVLNKSDSNLELYQIPVVSVELDSYGTYYVQIGVSDKFTDLNNPALNVGNQFYFDAIRVFNSAGDDADAAAAYAADKEYASSVTEIRDMLLDSTNYDSSITSKTGVVFVDKIDTGVEVATYATIGPNNEVYLSKEQAITFKIQANGGTPASIDIGAKGVSGASATLSATIANGTGATAMKNTITETIATSTAMFYDLQKGGASALSTYFDSNNCTYVTITNTGSGVLSLTDIKIAYASTGAQNTAELLAGNDVVTFAAYALRDKDYDVYSAEFASKYTSVLKNAKMTVVTTEDVETLKVVNKFGREEFVSMTYHYNEEGMKVWTVEFAPFMLGKQTYTVTGYGADGTAGTSEIAKTTVKLYWAKGVAK